MKNLSNNFLISMPHVNAPVFKKSLIYICNHDKDGAMGLIINKPISSLKLNQEVDSILKETNLFKIQPTPDVYFGGPVDLNMGIILHPLDYITKKTIKISSQLGVTSDSKIINDIIKGNGPSMFRFSIGYAGWSNGQLEEEFSNGDWLMLPSKLDVIFTMPDEQKWEYINNNLGIDISSISGSGGFA